MAKLITAENAASLIKDRSTIAVCGFAQCALPEEVLQALEDRFTKTGYPQQLTLVHTAGIGDGVSKGASHFAHEGMLKRVIAGHYNLAPKLGKLVMDNKVEGYNLPQGTMARGSAALPAANRACLPVSASIPSSTPASKVEN